MCGICGYFEPHRDSIVDRGLIKSMADTLAHRGPDEEGVYCGPGVGLGHRRLSTIDLATGQRFRTRSDTETIVHLYEELGEDCFSKLRGMFAIALWDAKKRKLVLARDRIGKKPLYYSWDGQRLIFGSEMKALCPWAKFQRKIDLETVSDYFSYLYIPTPKTIYRQVRKLRPAHSLAVDASSTREVPYWDLSFHEPQRLSERQ